MTAQAILHDLTARGVRISAKADSLKLDAPVGVLTDGDKEILRALKADLLAVLTPAAYLTDEGELRIPRYAAPRYQWWAGGQSLWVTLKELNALLKTWRRHAANREDLLSAKHGDWCDGQVEPGDGFMFCVKCGSYAELPKEATG